MKARPLATLIVILVLGGLSAVSIANDRWGGSTGGAGGGAGNVVGTGAVSQVTVWSGADTVTGDANFTYDVTNDRMSVDPSPPADRRRLDVWGDGGYFKIGTQDDRNSARLWIDQTRQAQGTANADLNPQLNFGTHTSSRPTFALLPRPPIWRPSTRYHTGDVVQPALYSGRAYAPEGTCVSGSTNLETTGAMPVGWYPHHAYTTDQRVIFIGFGQPEVKYRVAAGCRTGDSTTESNFWTPATSYAACDSAAEAAAGAGCGGTCCEVTDGTCTMQLLETDTSAIVNNIVDNTCTWDNTTGYDFADQGWLDHTTLGVVSNGPGTGGLLVRNGDNNNNASIAHIGRVNAPKSGTPSNGLYFGVFGSDDRTYRPTLTVGTETAANPSLAVVDSNARLPDPSGQVEITSTATGDGSLALNCYHAGYTFEKVGDNSKGRTALNPIMWSDGFRLPGGAGSDGLRFTIHDDIPNGQNVALFAGESAPETPCSRRPSQVLRIHSWGDDDGAGGGNVACGGSNCTFDVDTSTTFDNEGEGAPDFWSGGFTGRPTFEAYSSPGTFSGTFATTTVYANGGGIFLVPTARNGHKYRVVGSCSAACTAADIRTGNFSTLNGGTCTSGGAEPSPWLVEASRMFESGTCVMQEAGIDNPSVVAYFGENGTTGRIYEARTNTNTGAGLVWSVDENGDQIGIRDLDPGNDQTVSNTVSYRLDRSDGTGGALELCQGNHNTPACAALGWKATDMIGMAPTDLIAPAVATSGFKTCDSGHHGGLVYDTDAGAAGNADDGRLCVCGDTVATGFRYREVGAPTTDLAGNSTTDCGT